MDNMDENFQKPPWPEVAIVRAAKIAAEEIVEKCGPTTSADGLGGLISRMSKAPRECESLVRYAVWLCIDYALVWSNDVK